MTRLPDGPFFEIGPKNLLRRRELEQVAATAGRAGADHDVAVIVTAPTPLIAPLHDLRSGVLVFAQGMDVAAAPDAMGVSTAALLREAGADGVMLNHHSDPLDPEQLADAIGEAAASGLSTIVCADTAADAVRFGSLGPTVVLYEPPELIGVDGTARRPWIPSVTDSLHRLVPPVRAMHAGGVSTPAVAAAIMRAGADGTGSTSGVLGAEDRDAAVRAFVAAARQGWDDARTTRAEPDLPARIRHDEGKNR